MSEGKGNTYIKYLGISLIPVILILVGTIAGIFLFPNEITVDVTNEYELDLQDDLYQEAFQATRSFDALMNRFINTLTLAEEVVIKNYQDGNPSSIRSFAFDETTNYPEFSDKYNLTVDFSVSSYKVFGELTAAVNSSITSTAGIDAYLPSLYLGMDELFYIQVAYENGLQRMYPHGIQNINTQNHIQSDWYNKTMEEITPVISDPFVSEITNDLMIRVSTKVSTHTEEFGVVSVVFRFDTFLTMFNKIMKRDNQDAFLMNLNKTVFYHTSFQVKTHKWEQQYINQSIYYFEDNTVGLNSSITETIATGQSTGVSNSSLFVLIKSNSSSFIIGTIIPENTAVILGQFALIDILAIPVTFIIIFFAISFGILKKYGMVKTIDLEKLAEMDIVGSIMDNIPTDTDALVNLVSEKIDEKTAEIIEKVEDLGEEGIEKGFGKLEEQVLDKIDNVIDTGIEKLEAAEKTAIEKRDAFADAVFDKGEQLAGQLTAMGVDFEQIKQGDFRSVKNVVANSKRLEVLLTTTEKIDVGKFAEMMKQDPAVIKHWVDKLPPEYGITMDDEDFLYLENEKIVANFPAVLKSYTGIDLGEVNVDACLQGDFSSISNITEDAEKFGKIISTTDSINIEELAASVSEDPETLRKWASQLPPEYGFSLEGDILSIDKEAMKENLPAIVKSYMAI
ncbi:MAG: cache domain-containing protein [Candidatus Heimdallarchaeota archaeon]|nr:cache domain-containing protein [Candidatus Heimdallarchaeota archaeon]